jgi:exosortase
MAQRWKTMSKLTGEDVARSDAPSSVEGTTLRETDASPGLTHDRQDPAALNRRARPGLRAGLVVLVLLGLLVGLYGGILRDLAWQWWDDPNYTHGFLVPLFSGFLVWQRRKQLTALPPRGSWIGLPVLLAGVAALLLGDLAAENFLMRSSLIVVLAGLVLFHLGRDSFRVLAFPLLFLFFMVPLPATLFYAVAFPLQSLAARNAAWTLDLLGVPVLLDGNVIHLTRLSLGVAEACSGIRSLISLFSAAVGWAALTIPGIWSTTAFVAAVVPITILANAGRVVTTGLIGQWFGIEYAQGFFHTFSGWLVFVFAFVCLLGIHRVIRLAQSHWQKHAP